MKGGRDKRPDGYRKGTMPMINAFIATLFSGAQYRYDKPEKWATLVNDFLGQLDQVTELLGGYDLPLIWTADFMIRYRRV